MEAAIAAEGEGMMTRTWWLVALAPVVAITLVLGLLRQASVTAQTMPMPGQPLDQLSGDAFDQAFLQQMIVHHAMAVMMAEPVVQGAVHPEVSNLAANIITAQTNEIAEMRGWLKDWYGVDMPDPLAMMQSAMPGSDQHHAAQSGQGMPMSGGMTGQQMPYPGTSGIGMDAMEASMMQMMMQQYSSLPGPRLEAAFMSLMIPHHQATITMANLAPQRAAHQELTDLAASIVTSQSAEIQQMNSWLGTWYGL
jgi:uncharacterized protein (DUF305 family)